MNAEQAGGDPGGTGQPSEEELRAAYEAEIKRIRVEHVLIEQVVSLVNLGMRRTGLAPGTEDERDVEQVRLAIEAVRALLPLLDQTAAPQATQIREALTQLQFAYVKLGGNAQSPPAPGEAAPGGPRPERREPGILDGAPAGAGPLQARRRRPGSAQRAPVDSGPVSAFILL